MYTGVEAYEIQCFHFSKAQQAPELTALSINFIHITY